MPQTGLNKMFKNTAILQNLKKDMSNVIKKMNKQMNQF